MKKTITFRLPALNDLAKPGEKSSGAILAQHVDNIAKNKKIFYYDLLSSINRFGKKKLNLGLTAIVRRLQSSLYLN